jgi:hypothetical protein
VWILESAARNGEEPSHESKDALFGLATHAVKNLSETGVKIDEVLNWMTTNWPSEEPIDEFVCKIPISVLMTISAGSCISALIESLFKKHKIRRRLG